MTNTIMWLIGVVMLAGLLAFVAFTTQPTNAAAIPTATITNIEPTKKNLGCSIKQAAENNGVCISKELVLSD